jgi:hypothetical protein
MATVSENQYEPPTKKKPSFAEKGTDTHAKRSQERQHDRGFDVVYHVHLLVPEYLVDLKKH